jgi:hypothetical protein
LRPTGRAVTLSTADLFLELFSFVGDCDVDPPAAPPSEPDPIGVGSAHVSSADADHVNPVDDRPAESGRDDTSLPLPADRPTAGYPTVPVTAGVRPTWVSTPPRPLGGPDSLAERATVPEGIGVDPIATHSRATFGRMRRRFSQSGAVNRPQRTATTSSSARITDGE